MLNDDVNAALAKILRERQTEKLVAEKLALIEGYGEDTYEDGTVVSFSKVYATGPHAYKYAGIKAADRWYITGVRASAPRSGMTWEEFVTVLVADNPAFDWRVILPQKPLIRLKDVLKDAEDVK